MAQNPVLAGRFLVAVTAATLALVPLQLVNEAHGQAPAASAGGRGGGLGGGRGCGPTRVASHVTRL
jgi:hypothetical protein